MTEEELMKEKRKCFKESFFSPYFIVVFVLTMIGVVGYFIFKNRSELIVTFLVYGPIILALFVFGYFRGIKMLKREYAIKNGAESFTWEPYVMSKEDFLEECKTGFFYSFIKIKDNIHVIEVQLNEDKQIEDCYIDNTLLKGLDAFLDYKIEDDISLREVDNLVILSTMNDDPKKIFVDKKI